ncbi:MAG: flagellar protein FliJ [Clostridia bacterium]|nr:flagellar protein FliJ [Clostridia bacterium]
MSSLVAGFNFTLEKVHSYRNKLEDQLKLELAKLRHYQEKEQSALKLYQQQRDSYLDVNGNLTLNEMLQKEVYLQALDARIANQKEKVAKVSKQVLQKKEQVQSAMKERKILDRLRERQLNAFKYKEDKKEQKEIDDLAINRYYKT